MGLGPLSSKNGKHAEQWRGSFRNYASPVFGSSPVQAMRGTRGAALPKEA
jgi:hypothetical protein